METIIQIDLKTVLALITLLIPVAIAIYKLWFRVETNTTRVEKVETDVKELKTEKNTLQESINDLRLDIHKGFSELKLELKDKADRDDKR